MRGVSLHWRWLLLAFIATSVTVMLCGAILGPGTINLWLPLDVSLLLLSLRCYGLQVRMAVLSGLILGYLGLSFSLGPLTAGALLLTTLAVVGLRVLVALRWPRRLVADRGGPSLLDGLPALPPLAMLASAVQLVLLSGSWSWWWWLAQSLLTVGIWLLTDAINWPLMGRPRAQWLARRRRMAVPVAMMLIVTMSLYAAGYWISTDRVRAEARNDYEQLRFELEREAALYAEALTNLAAFFKASEDISRDEFAIAASDSVQRLQGVAALQWVPVVPQERRPQIEAAARADGLSDFSITEKDGADGLRVAGQRATYFPVLYVQPSEPFRRALGFDLGSSWARLDLLQRARVRSKVALSTPLMMGEAGSDGIAFLSALYVAKHDGFVVAEIHMAELVRAALRHDPAWAKELNFDIYSAGSSVPIYSQGTVALRKPWIQRGPLPTGDQTGVLTMRTELVSPSVLALPRAVLLLGILLATMLAVLGFLLLQREESNLRILRRDAIRQRQLVIASRELAASQRMASIGGMVAGITHEVNTPLSVAMLALDNLSLLLAKGGDSPAERAQIQQVLEQLGNNLTRAATLVNDFKRVSADRHSSRRRDIDCGEFLQSIANLMQPKLRARGVSLRCETPPDLRLSTRPGNLSQVLVILIDNALTHAFDEQSQPEIVLTAAAQGENHIELSCQDNGLGIPEDRRARIFDSFFTTKPHTGGTGLGLYLASSIVHNQLSGELRLDLADNGSRFCIRIPAHAIGTAEDPDSR